MSRTDLLARLGGGATTVCRCWRLVRRDGRAYGFTDHDRDLSFEGVTFKAGTGISARMLLQTTGLGVDNTEAAGALSAAGLTEAEIAAGRFDGAEVTAWLVDWSAPEARMVEFRGSFGDLVRGAGGFTAELRGLSAPLNEAQGRAYLARCGAVVGDSRCRVDLAAATFGIEVALELVEGDTLLWFAPGGAIDGFADRWFEKGRVSVLDGAAAGLWGAVKADRLSGTGREVELWQGLRAPLAAGDRVRITAGCDKLAETCRGKFGNLLNFRGFPTIPGEDWLTVAPSKSRR
ncbi:DUF2163 domain-containing protein [Frigidibacter sp. MR17.14]|uniref:DUF2163 domain-containing protein n=1 Tax=Frigidibacter sp. MR17.14 TaxID=3126509 RepID=UPI00301314A0